MTEGVELQELVSCPSARPEAPSAVVTTAIGEGIGMTAVLPSCGEFPARLEEGSLWSLGVCACFLLVVVAFCFFSVSAVSSLLQLSS